MDSGPSSPRSPRGYSPTPEMAPEDTQAVREVAMRPPQKGYLCRGLVCLAAFGIGIIGSFVGGISTYAQSGSPNDWLPVSLGPTRSDTVLLGSLVGGVAATVCAVVGCLGACRRSKSLLYLFGLFVLLLVIVAASCLSLVVETDIALKDWKDVD